MNRSPTLDQSELDLPTVSVSVGCYLLTVPMSVTGGLLPIALLWTNLVVHTNVSGAFTCCFVVLSNDKRVHRLYREMSSGTPYKACSPSSAH